MRQPALGALGEREPLGLEHDGRVATRQLGPSRDLGRLAGREAAGPELPALAFGGAGALDDEVLTHAAGAATPASAAWPRARFEVTLPSWLTPSSSVLGRSAGFRELIAFQLSEELLDDS